MNNRDYEYQIRFLREEYQIRESINLREADRWNVNREQLWMLRNFIKPPIDAFAKAIGEFG